MDLPTFDLRCAQTAELTFDRGRFDAQAARARTMVEDHLCAQRSKGCRDRSGTLLKKPVTYLLCDAGSFGTAVFGRWMDLFNAAHRAHNAACMRCSDVR
jgi:hypothetical protein